MQNTKTKTIETLANLLPANLDSECIVKFHVNWTSTVTRKPRKNNLGCLVMTVGNIRETKLNDYDSHNYEDKAMFGAYMQLPWQTADELPLVADAISQQDFGFSAAFNCYPAAEFKDGASFNRALSFADIRRKYDSQFGNTSFKRLKTMSQLVKFHAFDRFIFNFDVSRTGEVKLYVGKSYTKYDCHYEVEAIEILTLTGLNRISYTEKEKFSDLFANFVKEGFACSEFNLQSVYSRLQYLEFKSALAEIEELKKTIQHLTQAVVDLQQNSRKTQPAEVVAEILANADSNKVESVFAK